MKKACLIFVFIIVLLSVAFAGGDGYFDSEHLKSKYASNHSKVLSIKYGNSVNYIVYSDGIVEYSDYLGNKTKNSFAITNEELINLNEPFYKAIMNNNQYVGEIVGMDSPINIVWYTLNGAIAFNSTSVDTEVKEALEKLFDAKKSNDNSGKVILSDIQGTQYASAVNSLYSLDIVSGFEDGTFKPNNNVTRAQLTKMLVKALKLDENMTLGNNSIITDVSTNHWAYSCINIAIENGLIKGYEDNTFKPDQNVSYAESMAMLLRALNREEQMKDKSWPNGYMTEARLIGLLDNVFVNSGNDFINRGDTAIAIFNMLNIQNKEEDSSIAMGIADSEEKSNNGNPIDFECNLNNTFNADDTIVFNLSREMAADENIQLKLELDKSNIRLLSPGPTNTLIMIDEKTIKISVRDLMNDKGSSFIFKPYTVVNNVDVAIEVNIYNKSGSLIKKRYEKNTFVLDNSIDFDSNLNNRFKRSDFITINLTRDLRNDDVVELEISNSGISKTIWNNNSTFHKEGFTRYIQFDKNKVSIPIEELYIDSNLKQIFDSSSKDMIENVIIKVKIKNEYETLAEHTYENNVFELGGDYIDFSCDLNKTLKLNDIITIDLTRKLLDDEILQLDFSSNNKFATGTIKTGSTDYISVSFRTIKIPVEKIMNDSNLKRLFSTDDKDNKVTVSISAKIYKGKDALVEHTYKDIAFVGVKPIFFQSSFDNHFKREDKISMLLSRELEAGEKVQLELKTIDGKAKKVLNSGSVKYIIIDGKSVSIPVDDLVSNSEDCFVFGKSNRAITIIARIVNESGTLYEQTYEFNTFDI